MSSSIPDIFFKLIDIGSIESVEDNPEAVTFDILLSSVPPSHWIEEFNYLYTRAQFGLKPPVHVVENRLRVMFLPRYGDELQGFITFLAGIAERATREARRTVEIQQTDEKEQVKAEFRKTLAGVELPRPVSSNGAHRTI